MAFASGHGSDRDDGAGAVLGGRPHRRRPPALRRHAGVPAGAVRHGSASRPRSSTAPQPGAFAGAVQPGRTTMVLAETPSNPRARAVRPRRDRRRSPARSRSSTRRSRRRSASNRWPTAPTSCIHSATKGIAGHNDATLGVVAGERELVDAIWSYGVLHGATASPFDALNALRGVRTMAVRTAHQAADRPAPRRVARTASRRDRRALPRAHQPSATRSRQAPDAPVRHGAGVRPRRRPRRREAPARRRCRLVRCATSLGGPETLVCHPMTTTHASLTPEEQAECGRHRGTGAGVGRARGRRRPHRRLPAGVGLARAVSPSARRPRRSGSSLGPKANQFDSTCSPGASDHS